MASRHGLVAAVEGPFVQRTLWAGKPKKDQWEVRIYVMGYGWWSLTGNQSQMERVHNRLMALMLRPSQSNVCVDFKSLRDWSTEEFNELIVDELNRGSNRGKLEFDLPEAQDEFEAAQQGMAYRMLLQELDNDLRNWLKYGYSGVFDSEDEVLVEIRRRILDSGLTIWD